MINKIDKKVSREKRHFRLRKRMSGSVEKPRLVVFRSLKHIYAQVIDDVSGNTLAAANSLQKDISGKIKDDMSNLDIAKLVGQSVAAVAKKKGIESVVFDRAGYKYHGRVAALADGAREGGLKF